jgi:hypothetical protein
MKRSIISTLLCGALFAVCQYSAGAADAQEDKEHSHGPLARREAMLLSLTAKVTAVDYDKREITLKGALGNEETLIVDPKVKRLAEIKVGDNITADYYISMAAELRKPTAEEEKEPLTVLEGAVKAGETTPPGVAGLRRYKAVMTIEGLNRPTETLTLKGPLGHYHTVRVQHPENLEKMHIGEKIIVVFTEAQAISVEKVEKKIPE